MDAKTGQLISLALGIIMALVGGVIKAMAVAREPEIASFVFFSGLDYLVLCAGLLLVVISVGYDRLFGPERRDEPESSR